MAVGKAGPSGSGTRPRRGHEADGWAPPFGEGAIKSPAEVVGATPPPAARPVSLAVRDYFSRHLRNAGSHGVIAAISGGADSTALAVGAADIAHRSGIPYAVAIVDHGLRDGSDQEAEEVAQRLRSSGIAEVSVLRGRPDHFTSTTNDGGPPKEGPARDFRHQLLERFATGWGRTRGLDVVDILFGHTMDDQAETVLMRLGRGASPRALAAMRERTSAVEVRGTLSDPDSKGGGVLGWEAAPVPGAFAPGVVPFQGGDAGAGRDCSRGPQVQLYRGRPLLGVRRADTEGFCRALGLEWVEDPTNSLQGTWTAKSGDPLPRTALRHRAIPELSRALGQDAIPALARVADLLSEDEDALARCASQVAATALTEGFSSGEEIATITLKVGPLLEATKAVRSRVYLLAWDRLSPRTCGAGGRPGASPLSRAHLRAIDQLVMNKEDGSRPPTGQRIDLPGSTRAERRRETVEFVRIVTGHGPLGSLSQPA